MFLYNLDRQKNKNLLIKKINYFFINSQYLR